MIRRSKGDQAEAKTAGPTTTKGETNTNRAQKPKAAEKRFPKLPKQSATWSSGWRALTSRDQPDLARSQGAQVSHRPPLMPAEFQEAMWPLPSSLRTPAQTPNEPAMPSPLFDGGATLQHVLGLTPGGTKTHFHSQHNQPRPRASPHQFRVTPLFCSSCGCQRNAIPSRCRCSRRPITTKSTDQGGVHSQLGSSEQRQPIRHHFQSPGVSNVVQFQTEVSRKDVGGNAPAGFAANPCRHTLYCVSPSAKNPSPWARCAVMAMSIKWAATPASTHGQRKRQLETTEQEHTEEVRIQWRDAARRARGKGQPTARTGLRSN